MPDDSVPIFVQLNGSVMRIARPDDEGGWVRFVLARPAGSWAIVAAAVEGRDGLVVAEPGIELPLAMVRRTPIRLDLPVLRLPGGEPLHAWLNLGLVAAQFGPVAWMMLQEHLVRVVERAAAPSASLVIRMVVGEREAAMFLEFLYDGLRVDLADMLAEVFADFSSKPVFVTATKPLGAAIPLFATEGGTLFILATGDDGRSAPVLKVQRKRATLGFERLPDGEGIHFALRQVRILDDSGMGTVDVERQVVLRIAKMWTA